MYLSFPRSKIICKSNGPNSLAKQRVWLAKILRRLTRPELMLLKSILGLFGNGEMFCSKTDVPGTLLTTIIVQFDFYTDDGRRWYCRNVCFRTKHCATSKQPGSEF